MPNTDTARHELAAFEAQAIDALRQGREPQALAAWGRILALDPNHVRALTMIGQHAFRQGDFTAARSAFQRGADADGQDPRQWVNVALACQRLGDEAAEEVALFRALTADPGDLLALLLRGNLQERQGKTHQAAAAYGAAAAVAPPMDRLSPELRPSLAHALTYRGDYNTQLASFLDSRLDAAGRDLAGENVDRVRLMVDIMLGRKKRHDSQPMHHFLPGLLPTEFFARKDFPWLDAFEAETPAIRDEFLATLRRDQGFVPYVTYDADAPLNQWAELNHSPRWSVLHLVKGGRVVEENAAQCPRTMALWRTAPSPQQPGRTPVALFSLLKPRTRIPPHVGVSNCRLLVHVPLIVPEGCGFRVGNQTRPWAPGQAWVFDDSIEHEAWNDSDQLRVIMIFDIWHPQITPAEQMMIGALSGALNEFTGSTGGFDA
jgi:aspartyl/asparaginyl beta-hydroxylase (cupin superfamily)/Tfp pilus assembly protein PilF